MAIGQTTEKLENHHSWFSHQLAAPVPVHDFETSLEEVRRQRKEGRGPDGRRHGHWATLLVLRYIIIPTYLPICVVLPVSTCFPAVAAGGPLSLSPLLTWKWVCFLFLFSLRVGVLVFVVLVLE